MKYKPWQSEQKFCIGMKLVSVNLKKQSFGNPKRFFRMEGKIELKI